MRKVLYYIPKATSAPPRAGTTGTLYPDFITSDLKTFWEMDEHGISTINWMEIHTMFFSKLRELNLHLTIEWLGGSGSELWFIVIDIF